jgi:tartrate-resistant acid phosphatase type 5
VGGTAFLARARASLAGAEAAAFAGRIAYHRRVARLSSGCLGLFLLAACGRQPLSEEDTRSGNGLADEARADRSDAGDAPPVAGDGDGDPAPEAPADGQDPDEGAEAPRQVVRFIVLGDGGVGTDAQFAVADAIRGVCEQRGCDFALYTGDNIYQSGVSGVDDAQFETKFEAPYAVLDFPFFMALGNHDYGRATDTVSPNDSTEAQVAYTMRSDKWTMPHQYYTERLGPVQIYAIDTQAIIMDEFRTRDEQAAWLEAELAQSDAPWKIVFGHHPYLSNGSYGNASDPDLLELMEDTVCGHAQVYFAGHDHNREWLEPACGTSFIVSGAAAHLRAMRMVSQPSRFQDATKTGFLWAEVDATTLHGVFYDVDGNENYADTITLSP